MSLILFSQWLEYFLDKYLLDQILFRSYFLRMINDFLFYGIGLKSNDLGVNPYASFAISASVEILAYALSHLVLDIFGRKLPYVTALGFAGLSCFSIGFICK